MMATGTKEMRRMLPGLLSVSKWCVFPQEKSLQEDYMPKEIFSSKYGDRAKGLC